MGLALHYTGCPSLTIHLLRSHRRALEQINNLCDIKSRTISMLVICCYCSLGDRINLSWCAFSLGLHKRQLSVPMLCISQRSRHRPSDITWKASTTTLDVSASDGEWMDPRLAGEHRISGTHAAPRLERREPVLSHFHRSTEPTDPHLATQCLTNWLRSLSLSLNLQCSWLYWRVTPSSRATEAMARLPVSQFYSWGTPEFTWAPHLILVHWPVSYLHANILAMSSYFKFRITLNNCTDH